MSTCKNKLQEYTQKLRLPMPVYEAVNEGTGHLPSFKSFVSVNGVKYESSGVHKHKKEAEESAAQVAIQDLAKIKHSDHQFEEILGKKLLAELLGSMGQPYPTFSFTKIGLAHIPLFTSTVEIDGASYVGDYASNKREAETKAAFVAYKAIKARVGEPHSQLPIHDGSKGNTYLEQPIKKCKDIKSELKTIPTNRTPENEILVGIIPQQVENESEKSNVENVHAVEKWSGMSNANDVNSACASLSHNQLEQETFLVQQGHLKKESEGMVEHQKNGPKETEEKKQDLQEVNLTGSINKRCRSEIENHEQIDEKKKKI